MYIYKSVCTLVLVKAKLQPSDNTNLHNNYWTLLTFAKLNLTKLNPGSGRLLRHPARKRTGLIPQLTRPAWRTACELLVRTCGMLNTQQIWSANAWQPKQKIIVHRTRLSTVGDCVLWLPVHVLGTSCRSMSRLHLLLHWRLSKSPENTPIQVLFFISLFYFKKNKKGKNECTYIVLICTLRHGSHRLPATTPMPAFTS